MKIHRIIGGSLEANSYIIYEKNCSDAYIIDPGYDIKRTTGFARDNTLDVKGILLTHTHGDHSGKAGALADLFDCGIYAQREELDYYDGRVDNELEGGETFMLGSNAIEVLHTPGHTAGGLCFYSNKSRVAFTGDTIFNVDLGYTHFAGGSAERMKESLKNIVDKWSNDVTIYPGHGDPSTMKYVREVNTEFLDMVAE